MTEIDEANAKRRRWWAREASSYDKWMGAVERRFFGGPEHRSWAAAHARGRTLEVAVGTGLNLPLYPTDTELVGLDLSPEMLEQAQLRADELQRTVDLHVGDAHALPFEDASFDTVVCTYSLCNIPDPGRAVSEMDRVLKPGGRLILVDHVGSNRKPVYWVQKLIELFSAPIQGEHQTRRSLGHVEERSFEIVEVQRGGFAGMVERILAVKSEP